MALFKKDKISQGKLNRNNTVHSITQCIMYMNKNKRYGTNIFEEENMDKANTTNIFQFIENPPVYAAKKILKLSKKSSKMKTVRFALDNTSETDEESKTSSVRDKISRKKSEKGTSKKAEDTDSGTDTRIIKKRDMVVDQLSGSQITIESDKETLSDISFDDLEKYNLTKFPWPIKNKYLALFKMYGFPFKKLGEFENSEPKCTKKSADVNIRNLIEDTVEEANELFSEAGYEEVLTKWLAYYWNKNPANPKRNVFKQTLGEDEYNKFLSELRNKLAFENELAFELQQIKLLCGMIDEESYGLDGKHKSMYGEEMTRRAEEYKKCKLRFLIKKLKRVDEEIRKAKQRISEEKKNEKSKKREQILEDLHLWKEYVSPTMEGFLRDKDFVPDDGRIKDWFQCVFIHDKGVKQAPVRLLDEYEVFQEPVTIFDKESVDSAIDWV